MYGIVAVYIKEAEIHLASHTPTEREGVLHMSMALRTHKTLAFVVAMLVLLSALLIGLVVLYEVNPSLWHSLQGVLAVTNHYH